MCVLIFLTEEKQPLFVSWCNDESDWSPDYGYYRLEDRYSMDQTRLTLADPAAGTWRFSSGDSSRVAQRKCADKGWCTLHLCKSGDITKPQPRDMVIFKGQGHVSEVEKLSYDDRIFIAWSKSSYINFDLQDEYAEEFQRQRLAHFKKDAILGEAAGVHPSLLSWRRGSEPVALQRAKLAAGHRVEKLPSAGGRLRGWPLCTTLSYARLY